MSSSIKAIDRTTVHRICSGQVVLSLAIAVKELVENAIDAGATTVEIKLKEYGSEMIEVTDNGHGVHPENFEGLTLKHHTSKLKDFSDLIGVETFGFRGEALSSLCALCDLTVSTRHQSQDCGSNLSFDHNGRLLLNNPSARQVGTTICLANVFNTLPVRHKEFLRNIKREFNKMLQLLYAYCLVSTGVKISCTNLTKKGNKSVLLTTNGNASLKENVSCIFGAKQLSSLMELKETLPSPEVMEDIKIDEGVCSIFKLEGLISSCAHGSGRSAPDRQFFYINSRPCEPSKVSKALNEVYHQYNLHQYPFVFLNIRVAKDSIDVNVTPDKRQIFLDNEKVLLAIVKASLENTYKSVPSTFTPNSVPSKATISKDPKSKPTLSIFSQWRSKNDSGKRGLDETHDETSCKVLKLDDEYATKSHQRTLTNFVHTPKVQIDYLIHKSTVPEASNDGKQPEEIEETAGILAAANHLQQEVANSSNSSLSIPEVTTFTYQEPTTDTIVPVTVEDSIETVDHANSESGAQTQESQKQFELQDEEQKYSISSSSVSDQTDLISVPVLDTYEERGKISLVVPTNITQLKSMCQSRVERDNKIESVKFRAVIDPTKNDQAETELRREISKDKFKQMEIIGQFNLGFIIAKLDKDLFIIDQHASDEKFNFETLQKTTVISSQKLVVPQPLQLTAAHESVLLDHVAVFNKNGFEFNIDEDAPPTKKVSMTAVPLSENRVFGKEDIDELIFMLQDATDKELTCRPSGVRAMFASRACRKSVMVGTALNHRDMKRLVTQMGTIEHPWNCPHGRPTMRHLVNMELVKKI